MSVTQQVVAHLPYLRRYARALTGSQKSGDAYVISVLESLVADTSIFDRKVASRVALYRLFSVIWNSMPINSHGVSPAPLSPERRLESVTPLPRQAFLLSSMENFDERDVAAILNVSREEVETLLRQANKEISNQVATDVLIIEDEPLIAMDLEALMQDLGHRVIGNARTHTEAIALARGKNIGLILADIQLADGSSGLDAVNELLERVEAPVIFITAFPERLLTGQRAEPTYLVTKPFKASLVAALASQALFFGETAKKVSTS